MPFPRVSLFVGILAAVLASQLPEFAQQYRQRLGGAIDELSRQVAQFHAEAQANRLTPEQAVERLHRNNDDLAQRHGTNMVEADLRLQRLERQRDGFQQAGAFNRILVMLRDFDPAIAGRALQNFEPAVPTTSEGLVTTIIGFFFGGGLARLLASPFRRRDERSPVFAARTASQSGDLTRAEAIRLRARINKARLPRPGTSGTSRDA